MLQNKNTDTLTLHIHFNSFLPKRDLKENDYIFSVFSSVLVLYIIDRERPA